MLFKKNDKIGSYTVSFPHKQGSYAETYRVKDEQGKPRFLKLIKYGKLENNQFDNEGKIIEVEIAKQIKHHNLCSFIDSGNIIANGGQCAYFVTEYISGETLSEKIIRDGDLSVYEIKTIAKSVLSALQYLHSLPTPIIHNEITIQNIMLNLTGELKDLKLIDFGHARFLNQEPAKPNLSELNAFYLAPERFNGVCQVQSDLYSVGVMIYQMLYGRLPWFIDLSRVDRKHRAEAILEEHEKELSIPNEEIFELDDQLINCIAKALSFDIENRFQTAEEFIKAIEGEIKIDNTFIKRTSISQEKPDTNKIINKKKGNGFKDVAGMQELKDQLQSDVIDVIQNPQRAKVLGITIPNGLLFYGPPGCGKTFFAEKFAEQAGFNYKYIKCSDVASPYIHGGQGKIAAIFDEARNNAPTILFFDEIDAMITDRTKHTNVSESGEVTEFLSQMNNCGKDGVLVIGATNKPNAIDGAALRSGRLEFKYYVPQPDLETRTAIFEINLSNRKCELGIDCKHLAELTENYISADIKMIVDNAARLTFRRNLEQITQAILEEVIKDSKPSISLEVIKQHEAIRDKFVGSQAPKRTPIGF